MINATEKTSKLERKPSGNVFIKEGVRFRMFPIEFTPVLEALHMVEKTFKVSCVITGAAFEKYAPDGYHGKGYAWDIRTSNLPDAFRAAVIIFTHLRSMNKRYRVVFGTKDHVNHIHIEFRYRLSEEQLQREV